MKHKYLTSARIALIVCLLLACIFSLNAQVGEPFSQRYTTNIKGELIMLSNNVVSKDDNSIDANDPYNGSENNNSVNVEYIDIDNDPSTFSSSSSTLQLDDCARIRYAGLYWSGIYPFDRGSSGNDSTGDGIVYPYQTVKLAVPGGGYVDVPADNEIYYGSPTGRFHETSYVCYADVTNLVSPLADPNGDYIVGNVRASQGRKNGGSGGGWILVIVYEDPNLPGKYISTFDGYVAVTGTVSQDFSYNGFQTIPVGPVRARLGIGTLEGDRGITGDQMRFRSNSNPTFTALSNAGNPINNFFNSNITIDGANVTTRNPASTNTLGWDADIFDLDNPGNGLIGNNETGATVRVSTSGDGFGVFLNTMSIDIIEPEIKLTKVVEDLLGNDITGEGVTLGQEMYYVLGFQNVGNDNTRSFVLRDVLPVNVNPLLAELELPAPINGESITYTYDPATFEIRFNIPDAFVEEGDPYYEIKLKVKVVENCFELRDACSNLIQNIAYATYTGEINSAVISDDPSVAGFDSCNLAVPGATNFLVDIGDCDFSRSITLCGSEVELTAGSGFTSYQWQIQNPDGSYSDIPGETGQTYMATDLGNYRVVKVAPAPCLSFNEDIAVVQFNSGVENPFLAIADEVVTCENDGTPLPNFYLCGSNDIRPLNITFTDVVSYEWQKLDEGCAQQATENCPTRANSCTWTTVSTNSSFDLDGPGEYRLIATYQNGCFNRFYFKAYENSLDPQVNTSDILCTTPGSINITNLGSGYEYALSNNPASFDAASASWQSSGSFSITTEGIYTVFIRQANVVVNPGDREPCLFRVPNLAIVERDFTVDVNPINPFCPTDLGSININVNDVDPQYTYTLRDDSGNVIDTFGPNDDNNHRFEGLPVGDYAVEVVTTDGCQYSENVSIVATSDLSLTASVSQHIVCTQGNIQMSSTGGQTPHRYAIWSYTPDPDATLSPVSYNDFSDIPNNAWQTSVIFDIPFGGQGVYQFVVIDRNNCLALSNPVEIDLIPPVEYTVDPQDITCLGANDGIIAVNVIPGTNGGGFRLEYELQFEDGTIIANESGVYQNLPPGDYVLYVHQIHGTRTCTFTHDVTISEPDSAVSGEAVLLQDASCDASNNVVGASIGAQNVTGGTPPYSYSLDNVDYSNTTGVFNNLGSGSYTLYIRDANGCTISDDITVVGVNPPTDLSVSATPMTCPSLTADITVTATGGIAPLTYEIVAPAASASNNTTGVFSGLAAGTYTLRVTDANGCSYEETYTIQPITQISVTGVLVSNVSCLGGSDGEVRFDVSGFSASYDYTVTDGGGATVDSGSAQTASSVSVSGLPAGDYTITITDTTTNCVDSDVVTVNEPTQALDVTATTTPLTCNGNAVITAEATGGWAPYSYELRQGATVLVSYQNNPVFTSITTAGTYTVFVLDANGCEDSVDVIIDAPVPPSVTLTPSADLCYDPASGVTLEATVTGGQPPFVYSLNGGTNQSSNVFNGLTPGTYTVTVTDFYGCTGTSVSSVTIEDELTVSATLTKELDCSASPAATIEIDINGGYPDFTYEVSVNGGTYGAVTPVGAGLTFFVYTTLTDGIYRFRITDAEGCIAETANVTVTPAESPQASAVITNVRCSGGTDGSVEIVVDPNFGTPPYTVSFDGSAFSAQTLYASLAEGSYTYIVRDSKGCELNGTAVITAPDPILLDAGITLAYTCTQDATIDLLSAVTGGTAPYQYSIDGITFGPSSTFTGLQDGTYTVTVRDANGCTATDNVTIAPLDPPTDLSIAATPMTCPALVSDITVTVTGGTAPITYEIIAPAGAVASNSTGVFTGLVADTYTLRVTDANGCTYEETYTIPPITPIDAEGVVVSEVSCVGGTDGAIRFNVSGFGTSYDYSVEDSLGAVVSSGSAATGTTVDVTGLSAGLYTIVVSDTTTGCEDTANVTVNEPATALAVVATEQPITCVSSGAVSAAATGGWGSYTYELTLPDASTVGPQSSGVFAGLTQTGSYTVTVTDANGCLATDTFTLSPTVNPTLAIDAASTICYDSTNLSEIILSVTGGVAPYNYRVNGGAWQSSNTFSNLTPGAYTFEVRDQYGCTDTESLTIAGEITANAVLIKGLDCTISPDAEIEVSINGGTEVFSYQAFLGGVAQGAPVTLGPGQRTFIYSTTMAGTYSFDITDAQSCITTAAVEILPITNPSITSVTEVSGILCAGDRVGAIDVVINPSLGLPPFVINVFNTTTGEDFGTQVTGLSAGDYVISVTDANGCTDTENITITEPSPIVYTTVDTPITCDASSGTNPGSISVQSVSGGTPPYTYYLTGNNGFSDIFTTSVAGEDHTFTVLEFGIYNIDVIDSNGCSAIETEIIASPPDDLDIDVTTLTADCASGGSAIVTVSSAVGSGDYQFAILETYTSPYSTSYVSPDVPGGDTATFTGLVPGLTYTFVVFDNVTNCYYFETATAPINTPSNLTPTLDTVANVSCTGSDNGFVNFTVDNYDPGATSVTYEVYERFTNQPVGVSGSVAVSGGPESVSNVGPLAPGTYYILFTEVGGTNNGCSVASANVDITQSTNLLEITATSTNDNCQTDAGTITATARFGTPPYEFQLTALGDPAPDAITWTGSSSNVFNAEAGNYTVYVKDANNCIQPYNVTVGADPVIDIDAVVTNQCSSTEGAFDIQVTLANVGVGPYFYSLDGGVFQPAALTTAGDTFIISGLNSGSHTVVVRDVNGCSDAETLIIYTPASLSAEIVSQPTCVGNDGEIRVIAFGGSGNYTYELFDSLGNSVSGGPQTSSTFTGLGADTFTAWIYDQDPNLSGCGASIDVSLELPSDVLFTTTHENVTCNGSADGSIIVTLDPSMDEPPYTYELLDAAGTGVIRPAQSSPTFTGLAADTYTVRVVSGKDCELTQQVIITEPDPLTASAVATTFTCTLSNIAGTSQITVTPIGGTADYVYSIDGTNFQSSNIFTVSDTGSDVTYTITVRDANGCSTTTTVDVITINDFIPAVALDTAITCDNAEIVTLSISSDNGNANNYTFELLPVGNTQGNPLGSTATTAQFELLAPGTYTFRVTDDATGCYELLEHIVAPFNTIDATASLVSAVSCFGGNDGSLEFSVTGYTGDFNYVVTDGNGVSSAPVLENTSNNPILVSNLSTGIYTVSIEALDAPFCDTVTNTVTVPGPAAAVTVVEVANVPANCNEDARVTVQAQGGTPGYTYAVVPAGDPAPAVGFVASPVFELPSVTYPASFDIYALDANGCTGFTTITITRDAEPVLSLTTTALDLCSPTAGLYEIEASVTGGVAPFAYSIGNGFQSSSTLSVSAPGTYTVTVRDANGCFDTEDITIYPPLAVSPLAAVLDPSCTNDDGQITINGTGGSGTYEYGLEDTGGNTLEPRQAANIFPNLAAGDYVVVVYDATTNCEARFTVTLQPATPVLFTHTKTDVRCFGGSDGTITVTLDASQDNPPYTYELLDASGTTTVRPAQSDPTFIGLSAGDYVIRVASDRGCELTQSVEITEPVELTATATASAFTCTSSNITGISTITVNPSGGTGPFVYSIDGTNFQSANTFTVSDTGSDETYTITVRDANGCPATTTVDVFTLNEFTPAVTLDAAISCDAAEIVTISVTDNGNVTNNYTFELLPVGNTQGNLLSSTATTAQFELLAPGTYTFRVTDTATGCFELIEHIVAPFNTIDATASLVSGVSCFGGNDGSLEFSVTGYSGNYNYVVTNGSGVQVVNAAANTSTNPILVPTLPAGVYTVAIETLDAPFCDTVTNTVTVPGPLQGLLLDLQISEFLTCDQQGALTAYAQGGTAPYEFELVNTDSGAVVQPFGSNFIFSGLAEGNYQVTVRDAEGCTEVASEVFIAPTLITAGISAATNILCEGDTSASITVSPVSGGRPDIDSEANYLYILNYLDDTGNVLFSSGGQSSNVFNNLGAGNYSVTVTDGWGCDVTTPATLITEPDAVTAQLRLEAANTCATDAQIRITAQGGTAPYAWSSSVNGPFTPMSGNSVVLTVPVGSYQYVVRDANNCVSQITNRVTIDPIAPIEVTPIVSADVSCFGETTGFIEVRARGGLGNYSYTLLDENQDRNAPVRTTQSSPVFSDLASGVYYVWVQSGDCDTTIKIEIEQGTELIAYDPVVLNPACPDDLGSISVELEGGTGIYQYAISPNLDQFQTENVFTELPPGRYTIIAQDSRGCQPFIFEREIVAPEPLAVSSEILSQDYCEGDNAGMFELTISGGVAPYRTAVNSVSDADFVEGRTTFENMAGGETYVIFVRDAAGCETNVIVNLDPPVNLTAEAEVLYNCEANAYANRVNVILGDDTLQDVIYNLDGGPDTFENTFADLTPGPHTITVSYYGCVRVLDFEIEDIQPVLLADNSNLEVMNQIQVTASGGEAPYTFYFNGRNFGSQNEYFVSPSDPGYTDAEGRDIKVIEVTVVDANGCEYTIEIEREFIQVEIPPVFTPDGDGNNELWGPENVQNYPRILTRVYDRYGREVGKFRLGEQWDGRYKGAPLPTGDYWYVIKLNGEQDNRKFVGHFTLYR